MTKLKLFSIAALLSAAAFYQSLGVGSHNYPTANAFAYARNFDLSVVTPPVKRHVRRSSRH